MNEKNLIPTTQRSESEVRKIARKGGINSGKARREKKAAREMMQELLRRYDEGEQMTEQEKMLCHQLRIAQGKAKGDPIAASKFVLELADEYKQTTRSEVDFNPTDAMKVLMDKIKQ